MAGFKDLVMKDRDVVLNLDELGEIHDINGKDVACVIDGLTLGDALSGIGFAIAASQRTIYAKCEDLPRRKGPGAELMVDGVPYVVQDWSESMGMAEIRLTISFNV